LLSKGGTEIRYGRAITCLEFREETTTLAAATYPFSLGGSASLSGLIILLQIASLTGAKGHSTTLVVTRGVLAIRERCRSAHSPDAHSAFNADAPVSGWVEIGQDSSRRTHLSVNRPDIFGGTTHYRLARWTRGSIVFRSLVT
jgi:hypothetical protein